MPYRKNIIVGGEIYHVYNRSVARQPIFNSHQDYSRAFELINYYRFGKLPLQFSHYKRLPIPLRETYYENYLVNNKPIVDILAYCIMPNHFHFLLIGKNNKSISEFMSNFQLSYSKFFNTKYDRSGGVFQAMYKAKRIETDEQLLHVCRYIILNPVTSCLISLKELESYPWSSFKDYINMSSTNQIILIEKILKFFPNVDKFKEFIFDQVNYQRELHKLKHLI